MTPWTDALLSDAGDLFSAGRRRAALDCVLTVLTVHPEEPAAQRLAATLAYGGQRRGDADGLTAQDLQDSRLDRIYCHCDGPGCTASWISIGQVMDDDAETVVANPLGGRCPQGHGYFCRNHFGSGPACPRCGGRLDHAPRVPNGRPTTQTARLNATLVHIYVMWEGPRQISGDRMTDLLTAMSPDVFEENADIQGWGVDSLGDDPQGRILAVVARGNGDHLGDAYQLRVYDGRDAQGKRWALVKVFTAAPKHVDPDDPPAPPATPPPPDPAVRADSPSPSAVADTPPKRRWWQRRE